MDSREDLLVVCYLPSPWSQILSLVFGRILLARDQGRLHNICLFAFNESGIKH